MFDDWLIFINIWTVLVLQIFQVISYGYDAMELSLPVVFASIQLVYMMAANYFGQEIMDHNNDIFVTV